MLIEAHIDKQEDFHFRNQLNDVEGIVCYIFTGEK